MQKSLQGPLLQTPLFRRLQQKELHHIISRPFRLLLNLKNLNFPDNVNYVNSLKINVRQIAFQCIHGKKNGASPNFGSRCQATRASTTTSNDNREERSEAELQGDKFAFSTISSSATAVLSRQDTPCRWTSLGRSRSMYLARVLPRPRFHRSSLGISCWEGPISHSLNSCFWPCGLPPVGTWIIDSEEFLADWPCHFVTVPHHNFRGDLRHRLHLRYLLPLFVRPLTARPLSLRRALTESYDSIQLLLLSPHSMSNSQKFNIIHMAGYEFVASKWILWRVKFSVNECIETDRMHKIHEIQQ